MAFPKHVFVAVAVLLVLASSFDTVLAGRSTPSAGNAFAQAKMACMQAASSPECAGLDVGAACGPELAGTCNRVPITCDDQASYNPSGNFVQSYVLQCS